MKGNISQIEKQQLLRLARRVLNRYVIKQEYYSLEESSLELSEGLQEQAAGFVTLTKNGTLRGCIGEIIASRSIAEVILERTIDAAAHDSRFVPVKESELQEIEIEISILTSPQAIDSYQQIELGRHGIIMEKKGKMALFLPQVALEQNWDLATTLTHLSLKAGLKGDDWLESAKFEVFEAIVFNEKELNN